MKSVKSVKGWILALGGAALFALALFSPQPATVHADDPNPTPTLTPTPADPNGNGGGSHNG